MANEWSEREVAERWSRLFQWPLLVRRWYQGEELIGKAGTPTQSQL